MRALHLAAIFGLAASAQAQVINTAVDILSPGDEGYDGVPPNLLVLDVFIDVAATDVWTAAGIFMTTAHGAVFRYFDADSNTPGVQPGLFNPGIDNRFVTCLSKPRGQNEEARFSNARAAAAGVYIGGGPVPRTLPTYLNVAYFASPPESSGSPSVDGYIARIAVDLSATGYAVGDCQVVHVNPGFSLLACVVPFDTLPGFAHATFDVPQISGIDFWVTIPEPASLLLLAGAMVLVREQRRV